MHSVSLQMLSSSQECKRTGHALVHVGLGREARSLDSASIRQQDPCILSVAVERSRGSPPPRLLLLAVVVSSVAQLGLSSFSFRDEPACSRTRSSSHSLALL
jgi:hypothetical protein